MKEDSAFFSADCINDKMYNVLMKDTFQGDNSMSRPIMGFIKCHFQNTFDSQ